MGHDVRERFVTAAFELFAERGYEQTTVDDIAERAGVGRTTFFRTFRSKEDAIFPDHEQLLAAIETRLPLRPRRRRSRRYRTPRGWCSAITSPKETGPGSGMP